VIWGLVPLGFQVLGHMGVPPLEILAQRTIWAVPTAALFVLMARQAPQVARVLTEPRTLAWLALSAGLIGVNWLTFILAVNSGRLLETSLGYYINPLFNMVVGAVLFRERIDRIGLAAIALAVVGVALQTLALGHVPVIALILAVSFCAYGVVRKRVAADAQTGLLFESSFLCIVGLAYALWLAFHGRSHFGEGAATWWLLASGPFTAIPLVLFAWSARRLPFSSLGFLQFIAPTMTFAIGVAQGEHFSALRAASFVFIWGGAAVFAFGAWRRGRQVAQALAEA
jgi:chloramphenicol-sensitive protein RarD